VAKREKPAPKKYFDVGLYYEGRRTETVTFRRSWQQLLFHVLLNGSTSHTGTIEGYREGFK